MLMFSLAAEAKDPNPADFPLTVKVLEKSDTMMLAATFKRLKLVIDGQGYYADSRGFRCDIPVVLGETYRGRFYKDGKTMMFLLVPDEHGKLKSRRLFMVGKYELEK